LSRIYICELTTSSANGLTQQRITNLTRVAESQVFGWGRIPNNTRIIFTSQEFLLKWYNFLGNFCWNRDFLLCTTISTECELLQNCWHPNFIHFMLRSRKFWKGPSRESEILERSELDILPPTPQPWTWPKSMTEV